MHLSLIHNSKIKIGTSDDKIRNEPKEVEPSNHSADIQLKDAKEQELIKKDDSTNEKERLFKCGICDKYLSEKGKLNKHIASIHEKKKPFKCDTCDYRCSQKSSLTKHITFVHEGKKPFKYEACDYSFSEKGSLKKHAASVHE